MSHIKNVGDLIDALILSAAGPVMKGMPLRFLGWDGVEMEVTQGTDISWIVQHGVATPNGTNHMLIRLTPVESPTDLHEEFVKLAPSIGADPSWWGIEVKLAYGSKYKVRAIRMRRPRNKIELVSSRGRKTHVSAEFLMRRIGGVVPVRGRRRLDLGG